MSFSIGNTENRQGKGKNGRMREAYASMFLSAVREGKTDILFMEEMKKLRGMKAKISGGIIQEEISVLSEIYENAHNSEANIKLLSERYLRILSAAAAKNNLQDYYELERNKIENISEYLPSAVYAAKKMVLSRAFRDTQKKYDVRAENSSCGKNAFILLIIILAASFFLFKDDKTLIKKIMAENSLPEYEEPQDSNLKSISGSSQHKPAGMYSNEEYEAGMKNIESVINQLEDAEAAARAEASARAAAAARSGAEDSSSAANMRGYMEDFAEESRIPAVFAGEAVSRGEKPERKKIEKYEENDTPRNMEDYKMPERPPEEKCDKRDYVIAGGRKYSAGEFITLDTEKKGSTVSGDKNTFEMNNVWKIKSLCSDGTAELVSLDNMRSRTVKLH